MPAIKEQSQLSGTDIIRLMKLDNSLVQFTESQLATWRALNPTGTAEDLEHTLEAAILIDGCAIHIHVFNLDSPPHIALLITAPDEIVPPDWWDGG